MIHGIRAVARRQSRLTRPVTALVLLLAALICATLILDHLFPFPVANLEPAPSVRILDRNGEPLRFFLAPDGMWRFPVTLDEVSPDLVTAIIASEDRHFYRHPGVNPLAVIRALWLNLRHGRVISGASTIPMQVARLTAPAPRTLGAKIVESFRAVQLSAHYSKDQILTWYLNLAPFGGNVVGVGAAAWHYFDKDPRRLSLGEIALLSVLPRSPTRYNPLRHPEAARAVRDRVLRRFDGQGVFAHKDLAESRTRPLLAARAQVPQAAPHFCLWARANLPDRAVIRSSLDRRIQAVAESLVTARMDALRRASIGNAALVVLDLKTREILAHVGSADFWDPNHQGQVDNTLSRRAPGSTLKPFLYALAFDQGHLTPASLLLDVPTDFGGYRPENYGQNFQGAVSARTALAASLNVPAVRLLARCGLEPFYELLRAGGLTTLDRPASHYGLPLALGGCELRLMDLTNLYASLGSGGTHRAVRTERLDAPDQMDQGAAILSPEACAMVVSILDAVRRPTLADAWEFTVDAPAVAWKTGTSFGHRDAWAVGISQDLAIGVWVGNPDGSLCANISGVRHAGPLLFDIFRALRPGAAGPPRIEAPRLTRMTVCAISGDRPGPNCPTIQTQAIAGVTKLPVCALHKQIFVDRDTGLRLVGDCLLAHPTREETALVWPAELLAWQRAQGSPMAGLPAMHPDCADVPDEAGPTIQSPSAATPYVTRSDVPPEFQRLALLAAPGPGATRHFWYVDGGFVASSAPETPCFTPLTPGRHAVVVTDDLGRGATGTFTVQDPGLGSATRP